MTLQTIANKILDATTNEIITSIVGNTNPSARKVLSAIKEATDLIRDAHNWQRLYKSYEFTENASISSYDLPDDIDDNKLAYNTLWNKSNRFRGRLLSIQEWATLTNLMVDSSPMIKKYIILDNKINIYQPITGEIIDYYYVSKNVIYNSNEDIYKSDWTDDNDSSILDENLIYLQAKWLYLSILKLDYSQEKMQADLQLQEKVSQDGARESVRLGNSGDFYYYQPLPIII